MYIYTFLNTVIFPFEIWPSNAYTQNANALKEMKTCHVLLFPLNQDWNRRRLSLSPANAFGLFNQIFLLMST